MWQMAAAGASQSQVPANQAVRHRAYRAMAWDVAAGTPPWFPRSPARVVVEGPWSVTKVLRAVFAHSVKSGNSAMAAFPSLQDAIFSNITQWPWHHNKPCHTAAYPLETLFDETKGTRLPLVPPQHSIAAATTPCYNTVVISCIKNPFPSTNKISHTITYKNISPHFQRQTDHHFTQQGNAGLNAKTAAAYDPSLPPSIPRARTRLPHRSIVANTVPSHSISHEHEGREGPVLGAAPHFR